MRNSQKIYDKNPQFLTRLKPIIAHVIGSDTIYISQFVIAKIKGNIPSLNYHPEISDTIFDSIPDNINNPLKILRDTRTTLKFIFICSTPLHEIIVEIGRQPSGRTEINTIHLIKTDELKRLERKFPVVYSSSAETPFFSDTF